MIMLIVALLFVISFPCVISELSLLPIMLYVQHNSIMDIEL